MIQGKKGGFPFSLFTIIPLYLLESRLFRGYFDVCSTQIQHALKLTYVYIYIYFSILRDFKERILRRRKYLALCTITRNEFYLISITSYISLRRSISYFFFFYSSQVFLFCCSTLDFDEKIERDIFGRRIKFLEKLEDPFRARCSTLLSGTIFDLLVNARAIFTIFNSFPAILSFYFNFLFYYFFSFFNQFLFSFRGSFFLFFFASPFENVRSLFVEVPQFQKYSRVIYFFPSILSRSRKREYICFSTNSFSRDHENFNEGRRRGEGIRQGSARQFRKRCTSREGSAVYVPSRHPLVDLSLILLRPRPSEISSSCENEIRRLFFSRAS